MNLNIFKPYSQNEQSCAVIKNVQWYKQSRSLNSSGLFTVEVLFICIYFYSKLQLPNAHKAQFLYMLKYLNL